MGHSSKGLLACGAFHCYKEGERRKCQLNAVYRAELYSLEEKRMIGNELSGDDECLLITGLCYWGQTHFGLSGSGRVHLETEWSEWETDCRQL